MDTEAKLWWAYRRTGRTEIRNALVLRHSGWAERRARGFARARGIEGDDLASAAVLGLIEAIERFDPSTGVPFKAYASTRIAGALLDSGRRNLGPRTRRPWPGARGPGVTIPDCRDPSDDSRAPSPGPFAREPDPAEAASDSELVALVMAAMPDGRTREIARRRLVLEESVDEIALAVGLGRSRAHEIMREVVLPRARRAVTKLGLAPREAARAKRHSTQRASRTRRGRELETSAPPAAVPSPSAAPGLRPLPLREACA
jgi:RNA polymerase sigma factor (sigma-70 family)